MTDNHSPVDHDTEQILKRQFNETPNTAFKATEAKVETANSNFMESSKNFWLSHEHGKYFPVYNEGIMSGTFNSTLPTFTTITDTFLEGIRNILRMQCEEEDKTIESFALYIETLEISLQLIASKLEDSLDSKVDGEQMLAYLHASLNSFISTNIK